MAIWSGFEVVGWLGEVDISVSGFMVERFKNQVERIRGRMMKSIDTQVKIVMSGDTSLTPEKLLTRKSEKDCFWL